MSARRERLAPPRRGVATLLAIISAGALALRLLHLSAVVPYELGHPSPSRMDRWLATQIASAVADGDWAGGWAAPYDSSPAYSYFLAALYVLSGRNWLGPLVVQAVLGALVPLLLYETARRLLGWSAGVLAALLAAAYAPAIFYEGLLVKFGLVPFVTASLLLACVCIQRRQAAPFAAGLAIGTLVLLRPNATLAALVIVWWAAARDRWRAGLRRASWVAVGAALLLLPMALRDRLASERGLESVLGGIHFYIGTSPSADGEYVVSPRIEPDVVGHVADAQHIAEERSGRRLSRSEVSRFWFREGIRFVREHPGRYAMLQVRKLWFAFEAGEMGSFGDDFADFREMSGVLRLPLVMFGTIAPLGFLGAVVCLRRRETAILPLLAIAFLLSLLPFFVTARYRLPLAPVMIVLAAAGVGQLDAWRRTRRRARLAAAVVVLALAAIMLGASDAQLVGFLATVGAGLSVVALGEPACGAPASVLDVSQGA